MLNKNDRVPSAILSCFLIAFILQGVLKICGVFIFEKALAWEIFKVIDNNKFLYIVNYFLITFIVVYCLSFTFTTRWYSKKWYHYVIMIVPTLAVIIAKTFVLMPLRLQFICDIVLYVVVPLVVYLTTNRENRLFERCSVFNVVTIVSLQILLYYCYLGLAYWSSILNSLIPTIQLFPQASTMFLIYFEVYMAQMLLMLSCNFLINKFKNKEK